MTTSAPEPRRLRPVTMTGQLLGLLRRAGWIDATPADRYTRAAGIQVWAVPVPARTGHTPAQLTVTGDQVSLGTFTPKGDALDQAAWSWVDPDNLTRIHDYVTAALADAMGER